MKIIISRSSYLILMEMMIVALVILSLFLTSLLFIFKILLSLILFIGYFFYYQNQYIKNIIQSLSFTEHSWILKKNKKEYLIKPLTSSVITRFYLVIDYQIIGFKRKKRLFILRSHLKNEEKLRLLIKMLREQIKS